MTSNEIREKYLEFFTKKLPEKYRHVRINPSSLVLKDDPTTLFTSAGMQQLVPYLKGKSHPSGERLVDSQPCFRAVDIEEVGDTSHTTFFEMLGNWSLGDYFKKEQLPWIWEFFTKELGLPKEKLWVSVFEGTESVPKDTESIEIWKSLGVPEERIKTYGVDKNWWSITGAPDQMAVDDIGGPSSEVFYDFGIPHNPKYGKECHPNCLCGKFLEIGNSVFIEYKKNGDGTLSELPQKNVDFGGGLERIAAAVNNNSDVFQIDLFKPIVEKVGEISKVRYGDFLDKDRNIRIIADHIRASIFLASEEVEASNQKQGYVLRKLLRRLIVVLSRLAEIDIKDYLQTYKLRPLVETIIDIYESSYLDLSSKESTVSRIIENEWEKFGSNMKSSYPALMEIINKEGKTISGKDAFYLFESHGILPKVLEAVADRFGKSVEWDTFYELVAEHQEESRTSSALMFKTK